jgi:Family of unknown function (DUF5997)
MRCLSDVYTAMSGRPRLSVLGAMMNGMGRRETVLHPRQAAAALGVSRGSLRWAGQDRSYSRAEIAALVADAPEWLIAAREHFRAQREREHLDRQRRAAHEADELQLAQAHLRAIKDRGDTDGWAASVLHAAGVHWIDLGDGEVVPMSAPAFKVAHRR